MFVLRKLRKTALDAPAAAAVAAVVHSSMFLKLDVEEIIEAAIYYCFISATLFEKNIWI